jgi:hypothetical protein
MKNSKTLKPLAEQVLIGEIVNQSKFAALAADRLAKTPDPIEVARESYVARGKQLRELLNVPDESPLFDRSIRNHFEHYDERIEEWFRHSSSAVYRDLRIDSREPTPWGLTPLFHRRYNPVSQELLFRSESITLAAVLGALAEIRETCKSFALP